MGLGKKMVNGVLWSAVDRLSMQFVQFLLGIILARLLTPKEYGIFGLLLVFLAISMQFIDSGFGAALIQKKHRTSKDISTMFVFNIVISLFFAILLVLAAPYIATYYNIPVLRDMLRVLAIGLFLQGIYTVPSTLFLIDFDFKTVAKVNFSTTLIAGLIAIYLAYNGFGVWSLVLQSIIRISLAFILTFFLSKWKISFVFSYESFRTLFKYGRNLLFSGILQRATDDLSTLFIAKTFSTAKLGIYTRGAQFSGYASATIHSILNRVLFSGLSEIQDNKIELKKKNESIIKLTSLLSFPVFFGLAALAEPLIRILLTDKWIAAAPIMQVFCFARMLSIFCLINLNNLKIIGRTDLLLKQQYVVILVRVLLIAIAFPFGIFFIALAELTATCIHFYINAYFPNKFIRYSANAQLYDMLPYGLFATIMLAAIMLIGVFIDNDILRLITSIIMGGLVYIGLVLLFKKAELNKLQGMLKSFTKKNE